MSKQISDQLAKELEKHILDYPSLFKRGGDVLDHIFLVNGNGYEWENGEPKSFDDDRLDIYSSFDTYKKYWMRNKEESPDILTRLIDNYACDMKIRETSFERAKDKRVTYRYIYKKFDGHSVFDTIPDDALPIWKEAHEIVKEMMEWYPTHQEREKWKKDE